MLESILWGLGFVLLVGVAFYSAVHEKVDNAAERIVKKRYLKNIDSGDDLDLGSEDTVEHG